jgi:hypothetical protein
MAKEYGWWTLTTNVEPSEADLEHIGEMIKQGFYSGEIVQDEEEQDRTETDVSEYNHPDRPLKLVFEFQVNKEEN